MRCPSALAMLFAAATLVACPTPPPPAPPRVAPRLAEVLGSGMEAATALPAQVPGAGGGPPPPATPSPEPRPTPPLPSEASRSEAPACRDARAHRADLSTRLAEVRRTAGVSESRALDRASAALAACEAREDCVEGDPKERAARVMAVEAARVAFRQAHAALQQEELLLFQGDRAVGAACGSAP